MHTCPSLFNSVKSLVEGWWWVLFRTSDSGINLVSNLGLVPFCLCDFGKLVGLSKPQWR